MFTSVGEPNCTHNFLTCVTFPAKQASTNCAGEGNSFDMNKLGDTLLADIALLLERNA